MKRLVLPSLIIAGLALCLVSGCTTTKGPSDEEVIAKLTQECVAAAQAKDIDKLMTYFSDKFENAQYGDKEGLKDFLMMAKDSGYLDDVEIDLADAKTVVEGDTATVEPVSIQGSFGQAVLTFSSAREGGTWKIVGMDIGF